MTEGNVPPPPPPDDELGGDASMPPLDPAPVTDASASATGPTAGIGASTTPVPYAGPGTGYPGPYAGPPPDKDSITMGMLGHLLGIFTGWLGPLIIWLVKKEQSPFVDDQGKEALNFQIVCFIAIFPCFLGFCLAPVLILALQIFRITFSIIATLQANKGVAYRYPVTFRIIK